MVPHGVLLEAAQQLAQQADPRDVPSHHAPDLHPPHLLEEPPATHGRVRTRELPGKDHVALGRARRAHAQEPPPEEADAFMGAEELELELIQTHKTQKPMVRVEVGALGARQAKN